MGKTKEKPAMITPFSNGTEAMMWMEHNCECCAKAYHPPLDKDGWPLWPSDNSMRQYCRDGRECPMNYALEMGQLSGTIPLKKAEAVGYDPETGFPWKCKEWKDRGDGGNPSGPKQPRPVPVNQLSMGFEFSEIAQNHVPTEKREKVTL